MNNKGSGLTPAQALDKLDALYEQSVVALRNAIGNYITSGELPDEKSLYIDLCNCLILICSIQHQMKVNLWTKNSYRLWLTNWPKTSK
ncbi:hypothetical protein ACUOF4_23370, partial [Escherichia coli]